MRILAFSDLHCDQVKAQSLVERAADADLVIGAGDFASVHRGLEETIGWLSAIETPTLVIPGNNETDDALRAACELWPAARMLHAEAATVAGVEFFGLGGGIPVTPWDWSFDIEDSEAMGLLSGCPADGVLIVHSPPRGHVDRSSSGDSLGSAAILAAIEARQPRLAVCGHIHECWGQESRQGETRILNLGPDGTLIEI